jgi:hypothetical protein
MSTEQKTETKEDRNAIIKAAADKIESTIKEYGVTAIHGDPAFVQALKMSQGVKTLRATINQAFVDTFFLPLQGTTLGFITDKDANGGYDWQTVRDVVCEALLRGFRPVNNEFNIISGRFYGAKNGFERIVRDWPGVTDLQIDMGVPQLAGDKGALVPCEARWFYLGEKHTIRCASPAKPEDFDTRIPVKVNGGMGPDAIIGKATRKLYARVYQRLSGCASEVVDAEPGQVVLAPESLPAPAAPEQDGRRIKMGGKANGTAQASTDPAADSSGHAEPGANG